MEFLGAIDIHRGATLPGALYASRLPGPNRRQSQGAMTTAAATASRPAEMGWVTKIVGLPWLIASARRSCCSASGPRIRPTTTGAIG